MCHHFGRGATALHWGQQESHVWSERELHCWQRRAVIAVMECRESYGWGSMKEVKSPYFVGGTLYLGEGCNPPFLVREVPQIWGWSRDPHFIKTECTGLGQPSPASLGTPPPPISRNSWAQPVKYCWEAGDSTPPCGHSWTPAHTPQPSHLGRDPVLKAGMGTLGLYNWRMGSFPKIDYS